jgi:acetate kinase
MGTRSGDIDHSLLFFIYVIHWVINRGSRKYSPKKSGMLGLTGYSGLKRCEAEAEDGNRECQLLQ